MGVGLVGTRSNAPVSMLDPRMFESRALCATHPPVELLKFLWSGDRRLCPCRIVDGIRLNLATVRTAPAIRVEDPDGGAAEISPAATSAQTARQQTAIQRLFASVDDSARTRLKGSPPRGTWTERRNCARLVVMGRALSVRPDASPVWRGSLVPFPVGNRSFINGAKWTARTATRRRMVQTDRDKRRLVLLFASKHGQSMARSAPWQVTVDVRPHQAPSLGSRW
jgi:hypothetical protein